jgi:hypothetical protein
VSGEGWFVFWLAITAGVLLAAQVIWGVVKHSAWHHRRFPAQHGITRNHSCPYCFNEHLQALRDKLTARPSTPPPPAPGAELDRLMTEFDADYTIRPPVGNQPGAVMINTELSPGQVERVHDVLHEWSGYSFWPGTDADTGVRVEGHHRRAESTSTPDAGVESQP